MFLGMFQLSKNVFEHASAGIRNRIWLQSYFPMHSFQSFSTVWPSHDCPQLNDSKVSDPPSS